MADSGVILCGISDHDLIYIIRHAKLPKIKRKPRILTICIHRNLTESSLLDDLNGIPFDLISNTSDNANGLWMTWKTFFMIMEDFKQTCTHKNNKKSKRQ